MKLVNYLFRRTDFDLEEDDVESIFLLDYEPILDTILALNTVDLSKDEAQDFYKISHPSHPIPLAPI